MITPDRTPVRIWLCPAQGHSGLVEIRHDA